MSRVSCRPSTYRRFVSLSIGILLSCLSTQTKATAADLPTLFQQARTVAAQLNRDAVTMESYTRMNLTWQSHAAQVNLMRDHVNRAGSILSDMQAARAGAKPWHQEAIDRITPVLKELASNTESIINQLNENSKRLRFPAYQQYLRSNMELARELSTAVSNIVDYDNTRTRMAELSEKLEH